MRRSQFPGAGHHELWFSGSGTASQVLDPRMVANALEREERTAAPERCGDIITGLGFALSWSAMFWILLFAVVRFVNA